MDNHKISVVLLTDCFAGLSGGAEKQIYELAKRLDKARYKITIVSLETEGSASFDAVEKIGCELIKFPVKKIYSLKGITEGLRFKKFLKENKVDALVTYHFSSDIWGTFFGKLAGLKVILSNRRDMGFWRKARHVLAYKLFNGWVTKVIVNASAIKESVIKNEGLSSDKICVLYNGVEVLNKTNKTHAKELKKDLGIKSDEITLMHVANFKEIKGHRYLIDATAEVVQKHKNLKLFLIGEDELDGQLQKQVNELDLQDHIIFLGIRNDVAALLSIADICLLPSLSEGMSNSILEYMVAGKPTIATKVGGNAELIEDGVNGILVDKENTEELKDALMALLETPEKRAEMGMNSLDKVKSKFAMETMVANYDSLFQSLV